MGVAVEAFREVSSHARSEGEIDFNFAPCRSFQAAADGMIFDLPHHAYYAEASASIGYGVEAPFERRDFFEGVPSVDCGKAFCDSISDAPALSEEGDEVIDLVSPRISFSHDLFIHDSAASRTCGRAFPENRTCQACVENGDFSDGYSSEFEFLSKGALNGTVSAQTAETMISADELISEGKLIPMAQVLKMASSGCEFDARRNNLSSVDLAQTEETNVDKDCMVSKKYLSSVHLAQTEELKAEKECMINITHLSSLRLTQTEEPTVEKECMLNSKLFMQETDVDDPSAGTAALPASSALPKAGFKYSSKIKEFFRPKRIGTPAFPQLTRDHSTSSSSTCRIPVPARSFWPFTRSNSAAESKAASSIIPKRSFSAGDADASRLSKNSEQEFLELDKHSCMPDGQGALFPASKQDECQSPGPLAAVNSGKSCTDVQSFSDVKETSKQVIVQGKGIVCSHKVKLSGSPGRAACKRYSRMTSNFLRGSPGRRGGMSSLAKSNGSRIVLWNLERCSTDKKLCHETSGKRAVAYPVVMRVSPVINVAIYRGKVPSPGMFGFRSLFSSKKEKAKEKNADINNWRTGA